MLQWELEDGITKKQAAEKLEDLDFAAVVKATEAFVLVGTHVEAVAQLSDKDASAHIVPPEAKELSAFFRVWCLVEMAAALQAAKPVVLLVGKAASGEELRFEPNMAMLDNLFYVMDIRQAAASREEDRVRPRRPRHPPSAAPRASLCVPRTSGRKPLRASAFSMCCRWETRRPSARRGWPLSAPRVTRPSHGARLGAFSPSCRGRKLRRP